MKQVHALNYIEMLCASLESYAMIVCCEILYIKLLSQ